jgi:hypothetical protein
MNRRRIFITAALALTTAVVAMPDAEAGLANRGLASLAVKLDIAPRPDAAPAEQAERGLTTKSERPERSAWKRDGTPLDIDGSRGANCDALRINEWIRVSCRGEFRNAELLGGSGEGMEVYSTGFFENQRFHVVMPVRRGDRRMVQLIGFSFFSYHGSSFTADVLLSELWLDDDDEPTIVFQ